MTSRFLMRHIAAGTIVGAAVALAHGVAMLARSTFWEQSHSWRALIVVPRVLLAQAGVLFLLLAALAMPVWAARRAGNRRGAVWAAVGVQVLAAWAFFFFALVSFANFLSGGVFLMTADLVLVARDFAIIAKELRASLREIIYVALAALSLALVAGWALRRLARSCAERSSVPLGTTVRLLVAAGVVAMSAAAAEMLLARTGLAARVFAVSTPELAMLHDWCLERRAVQESPLVVPEDLSLVPIEPMDEYLRRAAPPADRPRWNVIVLMMESVSAGRLHIYGYPRESTPTLDRLARESLVFEDTLAVASSSNYAQLAALSSLYPLKYAVRDQYKRLDYPRTLLWDVLRPLGWRTAIISSQDERWNNMDRFLRTPALDRLFHSPSVGRNKVSHGDRVLKLPDRVTMDRVLADLSAAQEPFAWYVNLQGTHHPYLSVPDCPPRFPPATIDFPLPYGRWPKDKADIVGNAFDSALYCVDSQIARLDAALRERGLYDRTLLVITADHGEGFYAHITPSHGVELYRELLHVPLLMRAPGLAPGRFAPTVSQLDILPTLLARMGFSQVHPNFQGLDVLAPGYTDRGRDFCASVQYSRNLTAIESDHLKLIRAIHTGAEEFFDLAADPGEQQPLGTHPRSGEFRKRLQAIVERQLVYYADEALVSRFYPPPLRSDVPPARWRAVGVAFDFENGRYAPTWTARGAAFGHGPASYIPGGRVRRHSGFRGRRFASSVMADDDAARGELMSASFSIVGERMRLLVGGGEDAGVGVELRIDGEVVARASGHGADGFSPVWWDISTYRGRKARIRIYDESADPMGHILIDDVRQFVRDTREDDDS